MNPIGRMWPSRKQWSTWSLPSRLTAVGTLLAVVTLAVYGAEKAFSLSRLFWPRDQMYHSSNARAQSCEVVGLIGLFVNRGRNWADWAIGSQPDTPIKWTTDGKDDDPPEALGSSFGSFARHGTVVLTNGGKPIYKQLKQTVVPGQWDVWLIGPNAGVVLVMIESDYGSTKDVPFDIPRVLTSGGFKVTLFRGVAERNTTGNFIIYHIESLKGEKAWLGESWSIGTAGGMQTIWIVYDGQTADLLWKREGEPYAQHLLQPARNTLPNKKEFGRHDT